MDPESEHAVKAAPAGNRTLDDILPYWEQSMTLAPKDPSKRINFKPGQDYLKYEKMMQHWENFVNANPPPEVHLYWKEGLAEAKKRFTLGPKPTHEVRGLVRRAIEDSESDLHLVMYKLSGASPECPISEKDLCETVPLALARQMGMGPPQEDEFSEVHPKPYLLWEDYFAPKLRQQRPDSMTPIYASNLLAAIRDVDLKDLDSRQAMKRNIRIWHQKMDESLNTDHYADWMKAWKEEFPEVADPARESYEFLRVMLETEAIMIGVLREELREPEPQEREAGAANGGETGQEMDVLHSSFEMVPEEPLGGMELSDEDWEDVMDMA
ncbi:hypothetical protein CFAM422_001188 [Trichoderma lentiforme]|uniref:Uncharacterized protein n=1 Tax=Trichoderma lentiforme TaxID=1567552 RepID=A0A9P4XPN4_9HYPO|nr:hypothetical protein CFAM422_001188 [Trichoderma lentiforme]